MGILGGNLANSDAKRVGSFTDFLHLTGRSALPQGRTEINIPLRTPGTQSGVIYLLTSAASHRCPTVSPFPVFDCIGMPPISQKTPDSPLVALMVAVSLTNAFYVTLNKGRLVSDYGWYEKPIACLFMELNEKLKVLACYNRERKQSWDKFIQGLPS